MVHCIYQGVTGYNSIIKIAYLFMKIIFVIAYSGDSDEMQHYAAFHLGLHYLPKYVFRSYEYTTG